jgi:hypothetical protein
MPCTHAGRVSSSNRIGSQSIGPCAVLEHAAQATIVVYTWSVALVKDGEAGSVVTYQSIGGRNPQVSVTGLKNGIAGILRQAAIGRPRIEIVFGSGIPAIANSRKANRQKDAERQEYRLECQSESLGCGKRSGLT